MIFRKKSFQFSFQNGYFKKYYNEIDNNIIEEYKVAS